MGDPHPADADWAPVRELVSGAITSGGAIAILAFFLPWFAVSCEGARLGTFSPYERASQGLGTEPGGTNAPQAAADNSWWWLLVVGTATAVSGGFVLMMRDVTRPAGFALMFAVLGVWLTLVGLRDALGLIAHLDSAPPGMSDRVKLEPVIGGWLSLLGFSTAAGGAVCAGLLRARLFSAANPGNMRR